MSEVFKNPKKGQENEQIDFEYLTLFGCLHCVQKKPHAKAVALYEVLQDGGLEAHTQISASDKDMAPTFNKLAELVTVDIFMLAEDEIEKMYSVEEEQELRDHFEEVLEDMWLDDVYGPASRLDNELWLKAVETKGKWIFQSDEFRKKLFEVCSFDTLHNN